MNENQLAGSSCPNGKAWPNLAANIQWPVLAPIKVGTPQVGLHGHQMVPPHNGWQQQHRRNQVRQLTIDQTREKTQQSEEYH